MIEGFPTKPENGKPNQTLDKKERESQTTKPDQ
jgi:hypothetical protein